LFQSEDGHAGPPDLVRERLRDVGLPRSTNPFNAIAVAFSCCR
jgi:hypothetical protein